VLRFPLYEGASGELAALTERPPRWAARLFESHGVAACDPPASARVEALAEQTGQGLGALALVLRRAEARGWTVVVRGATALVATGQTEEASRRALEEDEDALSSIEATRRGLRS